MGAEVVIQGYAQQRVLPISEFLVDYFETALQEGEVLVAIRLPAAKSNSHGSYLRYLKTPADHRPLVNVSITSVNAGRSISDVALVVGAATPFPKRLRAATELIGQTPSLPIIQSVADKAAKEIDALEDARSTADYRRDLVRVLVARALSQHFNLSNT